MVLIITNNDNTKKLVKKYIHFKEVLIENVKEKFDKYVDEEIMKKNLEQFDKVIIDITELKDNKEEILKAITRIKVIYSIQIIIIALNCKVGNELLSDLFDIGIYDFIVSRDEETQREEFINALNKNNYVDALKFKINKSKNEKKNKLKKISKKNLKKSLIKNDKQINKENLICFKMLKNSLVEIFTILFHGILTILISVGATALLNSNIRQFLIEIIRGGK